jgi:aminoglycoside 2''-phosphotransferase
MEFSTADLARYRAQLQAAMPDFTIDRFNYLGQGWDNILFVVNGDLIARFAKDVRAATQLVAESVLLQLLDMSLPVRIPIPEVIAQATDGRDATLITYRLIPGLPLDSVSLTDELVAAIAPILARFLDVLHSVPLESIEQIALPHFTPRGWVEHEHDLYRRTRDNLRDALNPGTFRRYDGWWERYLSDGASTEFAPCLVHGDLVPEHILVEREPWRIAGVIDFGDAMWTDPALDLAGLPEPLAQSVATRMTTLSDDAAVWRRRDAYRTIAPLHAVAAGRERGSLDLLQSGIEAIRRVTPS